MPPHSGLVKTASHWIVSSDSVLLGDILSGREGKWIESEAGKQLVGQIDENTGAIGWGNTRLGMRIPLPVDHCHGHEPRISMAQMIGEDLQ